MTRLVNWLRLLERFLEDWNLRGTLIMTMKSGKVKVRLRYFAPMTESD
jgi:hypothetical protein